MIITYSRLSTIFKKMYFYVQVIILSIMTQVIKHLYYIGNKYRWRTVEETLFTFMMSKKII